MIEKNRSVAAVKVVAKKEIREIIRDGRLRLLGLIVLTLALAALAFGAHHTYRAQEARALAQARAAAQWEGQGSKNPHVAAHYGTHVFAPTTVATTIDPGISSYLGRSIKIEAHRRNLSTNSRAQDAGGGQQLGGFSVATIFLQLVPLLIIALGYGVWSKERERNTLRQLLSTGVERGVLFWGKAIALGTVVAALLVPAALAVLFVLWQLGGSGSLMVGRLALLGLTYGVYFGIFGALTLFASAIARSSRSALVMMVGVWGIFCLIVPRLATELSALAQPLPSHAAFARAVGASLDSGIDGKAEREAAVDAIMNDLLAEQGFADAGFMLDPAIARGAELRAEAQWEDMVFDHHVEALDQSILEQETWVGRIGLFSPYLAMRTLSAGLCGTDFAHHRHFTDYAELWRKDFVDTLNKAFAEESGEAGWAYKAGPELWKKAPPFRYQPPALSFAFRTHFLSVCHLALWLMLAVVLALWASRRLRVV